MILRGLLTSVVSVIHPIQRTHTCTFPPHFHSLTLSLYPSVPPSLSFSLFLSPFICLSRALSRAVSHSLAVSRALCLSTLTRTCASQRPLSRSRSPLLAYICSSALTSTPTCTCGFGSHLRTCDMTHRYVT